MHSEISKMKNHSTNANQPCLDMQLSHSATSNTSVTMAPPDWRGGWWFNKSSNGHSITAPDPSGKARLPTTAKAQRTASWGRDSLREKRWAHVEEQIWCTYGMEIYHRKEGVDMCWCNALSKLWNKVTKMSLTHLAQNGLRFSPKKLCGMAGFFPPVAEDGGSSSRCHLPASPRAPPPSPSGAFEQLLQLPAS